MCGVLMRRFLATTAVMIPQLKAACSAGSFDRGTKPEE
jgi:hypothetical protein